MTAPGYDSYRESGVRHIGDLPTHWSLVALKRVATFTYGDALAADVRGEGDIKVFGSNGPVGTHSAPNTSAPVVFVGRKGSCGALTWSDAAGFAIDTVYYVDPSCCRADLRWLYWTLHTLGLEHSSQDTGVPGLSREVAHSSPVPLPPPAEQAAIAAFLDRETGKIDALVEAQTRLIELLKEKRQAVISHAVTKGLDPAAPMKDSGVEWLGQVPAHWEVQTLKRVTESCCDGPFGSGLKSEHYVDEGVRVVRLQNIKERGFDGTDAAYIDYDYFKTTLTRHDVREGDVLIAGLGDERNLVGRACVAPLGIEPAMVKADCFRFRIQPETDTEFLVHQLNAGAAYASGKLATGSTRARIPLSSMMARIIALPPIAEQREIASELSVWGATAAELLEQAEAAIILLQERRAALISAAVTGKIDVRGLAPEQAEAA